MLLSDSIVMPLFPIENVLIWIIPFLAFSSDALVKERKQTQELRPSVGLGWGQGDSSVLCHLYTVLSYVFPGLPDTNWK